MKIYKSSVESFAVEVTDGRPADAARRLAYLQLIQRCRTTPMSGGGTLPVLAGRHSRWNREGRPVEWRGCAGSCPDAFPEEIEKLWRRAESLKHEVHRLIESRCEVREGVVSEELVYGELPVLPER